MRPTNRLYSLLTGLACLIAGLFMAFNPQGAVGLIIRVCGIALLVLCVVQLVGFLGNGQCKGRWSTAMVATAVLGIFSLVIIITPGIMAGVFMFLIGGIVALLGVWQLVVLGQWRGVGVRVPMTAYLTPIVLIVWGVGSMFFPQLSTQAITMIAGILISIFGVSEIFNYFTLKAPDIEQIENQ